MFSPLQGLYKLNENGCNVKAAMGRQKGGGTNFPAPTPVAVSVHRDPLLDIFCLCGLTAHVSTGLIKMKHHEGEGMGRGGACVSYRDF